MRYNVFKMFVERLLLFSALLYNTEAIFDDEYDGTTGTIRIATNASTTNIIPVPFENITRSNSTKTTDWYYGSVAVKNNKTRGYESIPVEDKRLAPVTESTDGWSYGSDADEINKTWDYESVPVEDQPAVSDKKSANLTNQLSVTKPYEDDVGYLTVDNGILTAHFPKKGDEKENYSPKLGWPWFSETDEKTTSTRRPYNSYWYDELANYTTTTTATSDSEITTTKRRYYPYRYDKWRIEGKEGRNTTNKPRNFWYYKTTNDTKYISTTDVNYNWEAPVSPIVNSTNSSHLNVTNKATTDQVNLKTPTSHRNPVNISINSSMNANDARNYGSFKDFLKKMAGYILPSASNIAPNSNITNLAVANGNGNMFFYVFN